MIISAPLHLRELRGGSVPRGSPRLAGVAEEAVERLLDVLQVHLDFLAHRLEDEELFLRAARRLVEQAALDRVDRAAATRPPSRAAIFSRSDTVFAWRGTSAPSRA